MTKLSDKAFTLSELMIAAAILAFVLVGLLSVFINCILLNELNRNIALANSAIQAKIEEMKDTGFDCLDTSSCPSCNCPDSTSCYGGCTSCFYDDCTFDLSGFLLGNAKARIEISDESTNLKRIRIVACFKSRNRLIGNDINNCQSSPVELLTLITR